MEVLLIYSLIVLCVKIIGLAMALWYVSSISSIVHGKLSFALKEYKEDIRLKAQMDYVQSAYLCCGINLPQDWLYVDWKSPSFGFALT